MDRFKLHVGTGGGDQDGILRGRLVKGALERRHQLVDRRWRDEVRVTWPGTADPVLRSPELAGLLLASATARKQLFVHLANQTIRQREAAAESRHPVLQGSDVVRHLHYVVEGHARRLFEFEQQQIG